MDANSLVTALTPTAVKFYEAVTSKFPGNLTIDVVEHESPFYGGECRVDETGNAYIAVNSLSLHPQATLIHELFHLKLRCAGFPTVFGYATAGGFSLSQKDFVILNRVVELTRELTHHSMFFDDMDRMGYDPKAQFNAFFREFVANGPFPEAYDHSEWSLTVAKAHLETNDPEIVQAIELLCPPAFNILAQQVRDIVLNSDKSTPVAMAECVANSCSTILQRHGVKASFALWNNTTLGKFQEPRAILLIAPATNT